MRSASVLGLVGRSVSVTIGCSFLLAACAFSPTSEQAAKFGAAATAGVQTYTSARDAETELALKRDIENRACAYTRAKNSKIYLPTRVQPPVPSKLKDQIEFLQAILIYSNALAKATDPAAVAKLEKAADGFVSASSGAVTKLATSGGAVAPSGLPIVGPAMTLVSHIGVNLIELEMRTRIRRVVEETEFYLVTGVIKLQGDIESDKKQLRRAYALWRAAKICNLKAIRARASTSGADLYHEYVDADLAARGYLARITVLDKAGTLLGNLLVAHKALLSDDANFDSAIAKIQVFAKDFAAVQAALEKARK